MPGKHLRRHHNRKLAHPKPLPPPPPAGVRRVHRPHLPPLQRGHRVLPSSRLRIAAMNVDGLNLQAAHGVTTLIQEKNINVFGCSETHYRADIPRERHDVPGYKAWHYDREGASKWGGGLTIYYREELTASPFTFNFFLVFFLFLIGVIIPHWCNHSSLV